MRGFLHVRNKSSFIVLITLLYIVHSLLLTLLIATVAFLIFLPAYSLDMIPCEELFSKTKRSKNDSSCDNYDEFVLMAFQSFLQVSDEVQKYIKHAEYY